MSTEQPIKVDRVKVKNLLAISECEFSPGRVTTVSGGNTKGKSSLIEALKALSGGNDPTLIRDGAKEAEIHIELSNRTLIVKKIREQNPRLSVLVPAGDEEYATLKKPQTFLNNLLGGSWFNPIAFMLAAPRERGKMLLETIPMEIDQERLQEAYRVAGCCDPVLDEDHPLKILATAEKSFDRLAQSREAVARDKNGTAAQLEKDNALDATEVTKTAEELEGCNAQAGDIVKAYDEVHRKLKESYEAELEVVTKTLNGDLAKGKEGLERKAEEKWERIKALEKELEVLNSDLVRINSDVATIERETREKIDSDHAVIRERYEAKFKAAEETRDSRLREAKAQADALNEKLDGLNKRATNLETAAALRAEARSIEEEATRSRIGIQKLGQYRRELLRDMPIEGLEVREGTEVWFSGHPFDRLSTAEQMRLSVELSTINLDKFRFVCLDGAERLDSESFRVLKELLEKENVQALITRVADGELQVTVENGGQEERVSAPESQDGSKLLS